MFALVGSGATIMVLAIGGGVLTHIALRYKRPIERPAAPLSQRMRRRLMDPVPSLRTKYIPGGQPSVDSMVPCVVLRKDPARV